MNFQGKTKIDIYFWRQVLYALFVWALILLLIFLSTLLFWRNSIELGCTRSPQGIVECSIARSTYLRGTNIIAQIPQPTVVDIIVNKYMNYRKGVQTYSLEIRSEYYPQPVTLITLKDRENSARIAKEINHFSFSSSESSFHGIYP